MKSQSSVRAIDPEAQARARALMAVLILAPGTVGAWLTQLRANPGIPFVFPGFGVQVPLAPRLVAAVLIAWWGASRPWTLAVAAAVATPDLTLATLGLLAAVPRLGELRPDDVPQPVELGRSKP